MIKTALTYDDVLLVPQKSDIKSRSHVNTSTKLTKNITIKIALVSANMDTVTESKMAIAMAMNGGIGIIHRFCGIKTQAKEVSIVKRKQNVIIEKPFTIESHKNLKELKKKIKEVNCESFLVSDNGEELIGIITHRDIVFCKNENTLVKDLMTPKNKLVTALPNIDMEEAKEVLNKYKIEKLPLIDKFNNIKGLITETDIIKGHNNIQASKDNKGRLLVGAAIGVKDDFLERAEALIKEDVDVLVLDIAHGHSSIAIKAIKKVKEKFPNIELIGGNIATAKGAEDLIEAGVDAVKVGIGPGSICTTRITTGFGVPQLTAIMNIRQVCKKHDIPLIADGGIKTSADITKAIAAGAETVMIGGQFAGTEESPGPTINYKGRQYKISRGMASLTAALSRPNAKEKMSEITPEGIEARVPYRGKVKNTINQLIGGLKSGMSYGNAENLTELRENAEFIRITNAGGIESSSHDNDVL